MDTRRLIIFIVLSFAILFGWQEFDKRRNPEHYKPAVATSNTVGGAPAASGAAAAPQLAAEQSGLLIKGSRVKVETDLVSAEIDTTGADLRRLVLKKHGVHEKADVPMALLQEGPEHTYVAQTGLVGQPGLPTHKTAFTTKESAVSLKDGENSVSVRLEAPDASGVKVAKIYTFHRNSYRIDVRYEIVNGGAAPLTASAYFRLLRDGKEPAGGSKFGASTFTGPAVYTDADKFHKVKFDEIDKAKASYPQTGKDGWVAMLQHYFATAWLLSPKDGVAVCGAACRFEVKKTESGLYQAAAAVDLPAIAVGEKRELTVPLYAGPEETSRLKQAAEGFDLVKDYGWLTVIAAPLFWVLNAIHGVVGNWGWAIILLTVMIKAVFYPLSAASYRSMAQMKALAPKLQRMKEQYGDDRQKFQQAMMEMYKTEKINPLGGCLPVLVQIPVFIALYWALLASVELRQAPWLGWIHDLSVADPYYILPVIMAATMILQSFMNPPAADPIQDKMMKIMPLAFSVMFVFFPAGLVLYWVVNNILSISQQWYITRQLAAKAAKA